MDFFQYKKFIVEYLQFVLRLEYSAHGTWAIKGVCVCVCVHAMYVCVCVCVHVCVCTETL